MLVSPHKYTTKNLHHSSEMPVTETTGRSLTYKHVQHLPLGLFSTSVMGMYMGHTCINTHIWMADDTEN